MTDEFDEAFARLHRSPFEGNDPNDVFGQSSGMPTMPSSAIEDLGFTPEQLGFLRNGLYNGDFRTPPPDPDSELDDLTNKLPGWSYVKTGTSVTARWVSDSSGGNVTFLVAAGAATGDSAYLEQIIPVTSAGRRRIVHLFTVARDDSFSSFPTVEAQYLDASGATTGSADTLPQTSDNTVGTKPYLWTVVPNGEAGVPTDGYFLRVRFGVTDAVAGAQTYIIHHTMIEERWSLGGPMVQASMEGDDTAFDADGQLAYSQYVHVIANGANRTIRGINADGVRPGRLLFLHNYGDTNSVILSHDDGSADAADRIYCPNGSNLTIRPFGSVILMYSGDHDGTHRRWRVMSQV